ncbi:DUF4350 domain-containing protein [Gulosibacter sp. 10]|uniref:DUF4350 domain-containing protein n=1 Tax=Gulosibacter sp. 10 TaxID=1255570 RepID=UPI00097F6A13|nr:DUF4350 domain-containing protein [Gulosibacter sp. 10]SJM54368.1 secreted protein [Gulosibacter sp. 10]
MTMLSDARSPAPADAQGERPAAAESLTPDARQWWRRARTWVWVFVILLLVGALAIATGGGMNAASNRPYDPASPAPSGTKGLVQTLDSHGVDVTHAETEADLADTLDVGGPTTLLVEDPYGALDQQGWAELRELDVDRLIVFSNSFASNGALEGIAESAGSYRPRTDGNGELVDENMPETLEAGACEAPLAQNAPAVTNLGGQSYRPLDGASGCYGIHDGAAIVRGEADGMEVIAVGAMPNFANETITLDANAAMAIDLLGAHERLVWYTADPAVAEDLGPGLGAYIPQWLLPATLLIGVAALAALLWQGRRFGPLVTERLPVTVPANETLEGRARLYDAGDSRLRAIDSIRVGAVSRLADLCGLGPNAAIAEVIAATAGLAGVPPAHAHRVLVGAEPADDGELVELANACAELERRVRTVTGRAKPASDRSTNPRQGDEHVE